MSETTYERAPVAGVKTESLARALNDAGFEVFKAGGDEPNLAVSPVSIGVAFGMVKAGASAPVDAALDQLFHYPATGTQLLEQFNALDLETSSEAGDGAKNADGDTVDLPIVTIGNRAFIDKGFDVREDYLANLHTYFGADAVSAPLSTDAAGSRKLVDGWVKKQTHGLVPKIMPEDQPTPESRLVLVNATYMKAQWFTPFDANLTNEGDFHMADGTTASATFMWGALDVPFVNGDDFVAASLPYVGDLEMVVVVPTDGAFDAVESRLSQDFLDQFDASKADGNVDVQLPKFDVESKLDLRDAIENGLEVNGLFGVEGLDGIAPRLAVDSAVHATHVIVDEDGTEAGAATAIGLTLTSAPIVNAELHADKPFFYVIRNPETGAVLFVGRFTDPNA
ncbi:MAG: serpin family protein [Demequina sp.]|nr:serpin family protein [Demequina sp.]